jgi:hypothetical protein
MNAKESNHTGSPAYDFQYKKQDPDLTGQLPYYSDPMCYFLNKAEMYTPKSFS